MAMNDNWRVGTALAGGYLLGRFRKGRLALRLATWAVRRKLALDTRALVRERIGQLASSPEVAELARQLRTELLDAGRSAAVTTVTSRIERAADGLSERTARLTGSAGAAAEGGTRAAGAAVDRVGGRLRGRRDNDDDGRTEGRHPSDGHDTDGGRTTDGDAGRAGDGRGRTRTARRGPDGDGGGGGGEDTARRRTRASAPSSAGTRAKDAARTGTRRPRAATERSGSRRSPSRAGSENG